MNMYEKLHKDGFISEEWFKAFTEFDIVSSFDVMYLDQIVSGDMTCREVWSANIEWLHGLYCECQSIDTPWED